MSVRSPYVEHLISRVSGHSPRRTPVGSAREAAVLLPFQDGPDGTQLILTRRTDSMGNHAGQVAFPGGARDPEDHDTVATALRETHEELGIGPDHVEVIGHLDEMITITNFHVAPVVALVPHDVNMVPNPAEVARVFTVPLDVVMGRDNWRQQSHEYMGRSHLVWHLDHDGEDIWGVTGYILRGFMDIVGELPRD